MGRGVRDKGPLTHLSYPPRTDKVDLNRWDVRVTGRVLGGLGMHRLRPYRNVRVRVLSRDGK